MTFEKAFERALAAHRQGKLREAFLRYDAILKADPAHAQALHLSGVVLHQAGQSAAASERIRAALDVDPSQAEAWSNLAQALAATGRHAAALAALKEALRRAPQAADIAVNLAAMLIAQGQAVEGEAVARRATTIDATLADAWFNLAIALQRQGRALEALDAASRAAAIAPRQPHYQGLKSQLEAGIAAPARARATLESALARAPTSVPLRFELATLLEAQGEAQAAADAYAQTLRLDPQHGPALSQLVHLKRWLADWRDLAGYEQRLRTGVAEGRALLSPFVLLGQPSTRDEQRRCADTWVKALPAVASRGRPVLSSGRLRVGYLSADFHSAATAQPLAALFERHDRSRFDFIAYSMGPADGGPLEQRLKRALGRIVDVHGEAPEAIAQRILNDRIDILVDLKGHAAGAPARVLALRAAPIQVHCFGYPGTLGGTLADYLIGDPIVTPPAHAADYAEALVRLPGSCQVLACDAPLREAPSRSALGLPEHGVVLCNFGATWKLRPEVLDTWSAILRSVPDAVLWLAARSDDDAAIPHLRREAALRQIDPMRLRFATRRSDGDLSLYARADLFLDTWPFNAQASAGDALWAGCPLITLLGETFVSRIGASLAHAVGLQACVAEDLDDYVRRAVGLAQDPARRTGLREQLAGAGRQSALFDAQRTARALEAAYLEMADQYRASVREPIDFEPVAAG